MKDVLYVTRQKNCDLIFPLTKTTYFKDCFIMGFYYALFHKALLVTMINWYFNIIHINQNWVLNQNVKQKSVSKHHSIFKALISALKFPWTSKYFSCIRAMYRYLQDNKDIHSYTYQCKFIYIDKEMLLFAYVYSWKWGKKSKPNKYLICRAPVI